MITRHSSITSEFDAYLGCAAGIGTIEPWACDQHKTEAIAENRNVWKNNQSAKLEY